MASLFEEMGSTYTLGADGMYYPNLELPEEETPRFGKYGRMRHNTTLTSTNTHSQRIVLMEEHKSSLAVLTYREGAFLFLFFCLLIQGNVSEIHQNVHEYNREVNQINDKYVIKLAGNDFRSSSCDIASEDQENKRQASRFCRARFVSLHSIDRPG